MVARHLSVRRRRDPSIDVDQTSKPGRVAVLRRSVQPPGAMVDMCSIGCDGRLLNEQYVQVLALVVTDQGFHPRPRFSTREFVSNIVTGSTRFGYCRSPVGCLPLQSRHHVRTPEGRRSDRTAVFSCTTRPGSRIFDSANIASA